MITIKSKREIELMQEACKVTALTYEYIEKIIKPGMSTLELDQMAEKFIKEHGGVSAQKGYPSGVRGVPNFPGTLCISINDEVIHGIPSKDVYIKDGDIVSVDLVVLKNGYISYAVDSYVRQFGFSVVREFQGHGIGKEMHEDPGVPNYGKPGRGPKLEPGMTIAVEPMVIAGKPNIWELDDGWTIVTQDGSLAAHYENTILITENEPKILTLL